MYQLDDQQLINAYKKAVKLGLSNEFLFLLEKEIYRRSLFVTREQEQ